IAENIASFYGAWAYPDQLVAWRPVHVSKITSWYLLVIISIIIVAQLKFIKQKWEQEQIITKSEATLK
ncbi:YoaT, partial [Listeria innocua FSL J1-023]